MTKIRLALICLPCFAVGWWLDARLGAAPPDVVESWTKIPIATPRGKSFSSSNLHAGVSEITAIPDEINSPEELLALIIPDRPAATTERLKRAVGRLSKEQLIQFARKLQPATQPYELVIGRWIGLDPIPGIEWAIKRGYEDFSPIIDGILEVFKTDRATAVRLQGLFPIESRGDFLTTRGYCIELMEGEDPQEALQFIMDMDLKTRSDLQTPDFIGNFGERWIKADAPAAMNWALKQPVGQTRSKILYQMAEAWGQIDDAAARKFIAEVPKSQLPNGRLRGSLMSAIQHKAELGEGASKP